MYALVFGSLLFFFFVTCSTRKTIQMVFNPSRNARAGLIDQKQDSQPELLTLNEGEKSKLEGIPVLRTRRFAAVLARCGFREIKLQLKGAKERRQKDAAESRGQDSSRPKTKRQNR